MHSGLRSSIPSTIMHRKRQTTVDTGRLLKNLLRIAIRSSAVLRQNFAPREDREGQKKSGGILSQTQGSSPTYMYAGIKGKA